MKFFAWLKTRFVLWVWNHTPTCAEMSRLTSRSLEQPLSLRMQFKTRLHFVICAWCRRYFDQINFLHEHAPRLGMQLTHEPEKHEKTLPTQTLRPEAKDRMKERLKSGK